jgi:hypothetical protein
VHFDEKQDSSEGKAVDENRGKQDPENIRPFKEGF